jgi:hypothetical protein
VRKSEIRSGKWQSHFQQKSPVLYFGFGFFGAGEGKTGPLRRLSRDPDFSSKNRPAAKTQPGSPI